MRSEGTIQNPNFQTRAEPGRSVRNQLSIEITDDGSGLPFDHRAGVGLNSMRERALELGGALEIESEPGQGTVVRVKLPVP